MILLLFMILFYKEYRRFCENDNQLYHFSIKFFNFLKTNFYFFQSYIQKYYLFYHLSFPPLLSFPLSLSIKYAHTYTIK